MNRFMKFGICLYLVSCLLVVGSTAISFDPLEIGVGARPMGMGRAYSALPGNFFVNPSSIATIKNFNLLSMNANLLQNVNYTVMGVANPFTFGTLAVGYVSSGVASIPLTRLSGSTIEVYGQTDYSNNVILATYALPANYLTGQLPFLSEVDFFNYMDFGTNLKLYSQGFSNLTGAMASAKGSGMDMDFGINYDPSNPFIFGLTLQNALPMSMGGKFTWEKNNVEEGIPALLKLGSAYDWKERNLIFSLDYDKYVTLNRPAVFHAGVEWQAAPMLALRLGIDQQSSSVQVDNNLTGGVGLNFRGFTFDYAYHQYGEITENTAHYISLGYVGETSPVVAATPKLAPAKKGISFSDVPNGYWSKQAIIRLATLGIINGYPDGTFRPEKTLSRAELCTLLIKAKRTRTRTPNKPIFTDLALNHWATPYIAAAVNAKLVTGYPDGTFQPNKALSRAEAVKIVAVFDRLPTGTVAGNPFPDVKAGHWAAPYILAAKNAGLLNYLQGKNFEPNRKLARAEAAEILYRTNFIKRIK
jgi:S-layer homology domain